MNKENLVKLAKSILEKVTDDQFNMESFRSIGGGDPCDFKSKNDCGTIGCALGWAPFVKGLEVVEGDFDCFGELCFYVYSKRVFGVIKTPQWGFLFNGCWCDADNTREGFVKRVIYLLEGGVVFSKTTSQYEEINPNKIYNY